MTRAAIIAAVYVALTLLASALGLASGAVQIRLSEIITVLPAFTPIAIPGLTAGCFIANLITGCAAWDVIFGTLATYLGAIGTRFIAKKNKFLAPIPPILANTVIVPFVLKFAYGVEELLPFLFLSVGIGEIISCGILGIILIPLLEKHKSIF